MNAQATVLQTAREITLAEICSTFIDEELLAFSQQTQQWYRCRLGLFVTALGPERELSTITKADLLTYWKTLEARTRTLPPDLSVETFHGYVRAVRRLFKWLYENHLTITELWLVLKLPKIPERARKGVDNAVVIKMMEGMRESPRDYALILFLESTGARRGGVASLTLADINPDAPEPLCRRATVHEKGERVRQVIMSAEALVALRAWLAVRHSQTEFVFTDSHPGRDRGLLPGAINQILARYKKALGIKGRCSPHQWRHHFCRARLMEDVPLSIVSQLAGHKSVVVTAQFYGNLLIDELQRSYDQHYRAPGQEQKLE
jgi:site-specific recombinase XerD